MGGGGGGTSATSLLITFIFILCIFSRFLRGWGTGATSLSNCICFYFCIFFRDVYELLPFFNPNHCGVLVQILPRITFVFNLYIFFLNVMTYYLFNIIITSKKTVLCISFFVGGGGTGAISFSVITFVFIVCIFFFAFFICFFEGGGRVTGATSL